jgi:hypothetical protein
LLLIAVVPALATEAGGIKFSGESSSQDMGDAARETLVDSWNDTQTPWMAGPIRPSISVFPTPPAPATR